MKKSKSKNIKSLRIKKVNIVYLPNNNLIDKRNIVLGPKFVFTGPRIAIQMNI